MIEDDIEVDDVDITKKFSAWWKIELKEGDDDMDGRCIHQCVDIAKDVATTVGETIVGEDEEVMMDAPKDLVPEDRATSSFDEGVVPGRRDDDISGKVGVEDILAT